MNLAPRQLAFASAALRHVRDAEGLVASSPDQAWHLVGFGPECVRKACLSDAVFGKVLGHDLGSRADAMLDLALSLDPAAVRYRLDGWATDRPVLDAWNPQARYDQSGTPRPGLPALLAVSRALVDRVTADLWADGVLVDLVRLS